MVLAFGQGYGQRTASSGAPLADRAAANVAGGRRRLHRLRLAEKAGKKQGFLLDSAVVAGAVVHPGQDRAAPFPGRRLSLLAATRAAQRTASRSCARAAALQSWQRCLADDQRI